VEELQRIAKEYYRNCVDLKLFGWKGWGFIILGSPCFALSILVTLKHSNFSLIIVFFQLIGSIFWKKAKKIYDQNLMVRLKAITKLDNKELKEHKIFYLSSLTSHIGNSLYDVVKHTTEIVSVFNKNRSYTPNNLGYHFSKFIYDPDSKNRILSLIIYFISLIAILTVVKPATNIDIYSIVDSITFNGVVTYFGMAAFFIILFYFVFMLPISIAIGYVISPIMRSFSNNSFLLGYFLAEVCKYAFSDKPLTKKLKQSRAIPYP
jgi:hypothetical protein